MKKTKSNKQVLTNEILSQIKKGFKSTDQKFTKIGEKFVKIDEKFVKIDEKFAKIDEKFAKIDEQFVKARLEMQTFREDMNNGFKQFSTYVRQEFAEVNERLDKTLTRSEFLEFVHGLKGSLEELRDIRQNRLLFENQFVDLDNTVANHENRIKKLEKKENANI